MVAEIGIAFGNIVNKHPEVFSGMYFSPDGRVVNVPVVCPDDPAVAELKRLRNRLDPEGVRTRLVPAPYSTAFLEQAVHRISSTYMHAGSRLVGVGIGMTRLHVVIEPRPGMPDLRTDPLAQEIARTYGDAVEFEVSPGPVTGASS